ncbi:MAM and LDL-receptor class A domain-containing protein 1-like [Anneissia japonica]|uniref:MAM and LDL-receptor class A domain-containing protein 1-like n=1 Tax=Anneissia japonica TaxID=1529436 RepID=UPI001425B120|nr:MAM and LDL-receptor class A domain-containing protein 1-like [Anneissia japonica]
MIFNRGGAVVCLIMFLTIVAHGKRRIGGERLKCDFEEDMCRIKQDKTDDGRWIRWNGDGQISKLETPSNQLNNNDTGYFMHAYASGISRLLSPQYPSVGAGGPKCLTFWYNIFGSRRSGTLSIYQSLNETYFGQPIWQITGDMGNVWRPIEIDLTSDHSFRIVFEADREMRDISISIDNILISDNVCPGGMYSLDPKLTCDFENEQLCGYVQDLSDDLDWKRYSAQDGASGDGPDEDHTFGEDYGFYICMNQQRTPKLPGHRSRVISPVFNTSSDDDDHCIKFWYFLSGYEVGEINVYMYYGDTLETMFNVGDDQSDIWHRAYFPVPPNVESFKIGFESVRGQGDGVHCIDDVEIIDGTCETLLTTAAPVITTPELLIDNANCDFETDCIDMYTNQYFGESDITSGENAYDKWLTSHSNSHYGRYLPSKDHTLGTTAGHYMHPSRNYNNKIVSLRTPMMYQRNHTKCLQFYFTLNDQYSTAHLNVYIDDSASAGMPTDPVWTKYTSSAYSEWTLAEIDILPTGGDFSVIFNAVTGSGNGVDVAIDDIVFLDQECSSVTIAPWISTIDCDFESEDLCGYTNAFSENWIRINGSTPSKDTGPHDDHTTNTAQGHYMYMESSPPNFHGSRARLVSPYINYVDGPMCLQFWYNMNGEDIGSLNVYRHNPSSSSLWYMSGNQGPEWKLAKVDVNFLRTSYSGDKTYVDFDFQVAFDSTLGKGYRGDIAIDDVKLLNQDCNSVQPQARKSIDCDAEAGIDECGFTSDPRYRSWMYFDYKSSEETIKTAKFPPSLMSEYNSFLYCDQISYNSHTLLVSPPVMPAPEHCLTFSYIIKGANLRVSVKKKASEYMDIIALKKELSPLWRSIQIPMIVNTTDSFTVMFKGEYSSYHNFVALDDIKVMPGRCPDAIPVEKLACDFEKDCRFVVSDAEDYAWQISNKDVHNRLLPSYDHTFGTPSGHYFFISFGRNYHGEDRRLLRTPLVKQTGSKRCLQFYFYMDSYKTNMLNVYVEDASLGRLHGDPIWRTYGRSVDASQWIKASVDIMPTEEDFSVVFEPIPKPYQEAAIAIDDVIILRQKCSKVIEQEWKSTVDCDFEKNNCGYSVPKDKGKYPRDFQWQKNAGMTKTYDTGPNTDHTFELSDAKEGNYMYIETSPPRKPGEVAILESPLVLPINTSVCLEFWYNMFGEDTGTLEVYRSQPAMPSYTGYKLLWRKQGQRSKRWLKAEVPLNTNYKDGHRDFIEHTSKIHFKGTVGYGYKGDIAIDDIKLVLKSCEPPPKPRDPPPVNKTICDFENGANECGFQDFGEEGSGAEWNYFNASSVKFDPTIENDDPRVNMSKGKKSFIFADASELRAGEHVIIMTPTVAANNNYCLVFSYVATNDFIINIYSRKDSGEENFINQLTGEDVLSWTTKAVHVPPHAEPFNIVFEGVIGREDDGFLALDDIQVQDGECPTGAPEVTDSVRGIADDLKDEPTQDKSQSTVSTVVIALLTITLLVAFAFVIFLVLVVKGYRKRLSSSNSIITESGKESGKKPSNSENP